MFGHPVPMAVARVKKAKAAKPEKAKPQPNAEAAAKIATSRAAARQLSEPPTSRHFTKRNRELEELFLTGLRNSWSVSKSARAVGIDPTTAYDWKNASLASKQEDGSYKDDFCLRWAEAYETGVDRIEDECIRRAVEGVEKPVYQGGVLVGSVTEYSDTLAGLVMRGKRPGVYNTERHEHSGPGGGAINMSLKLEFVDVPLKGKAK